MPGRGVTGQVAPGRGSAGAVGPGRVAAGSVAAAAPTRIVASGGGEGAGAQPQRPGKFNPCFSRNYFFFFAIFCFAKELSLNFTRMSQLFL